MRMTKRFLKKLKWMAINVLAPEWALGKAWSDNRSVSTLKEDFDTRSKKDGVPWSRTHTYFANMGGFAIRFTEQACRAKEEPTRNVLGPTSNDASSGNQGINDLGELPVTHNRASDIHEYDLSREITVITKDPGVSMSPTSPTLSTDKPSSPESRTENPQLEANASGAISEEASQINLQTQEVHDEINDEYDQQELPDYIRADLDKWKRDGYISADILEQSIKNLSQSVGTIAWTPNDTNMRTAEKALKIGTLEYFAVADWEKFRFLRYPNSWITNLQVLQGDLWVLDAQQLLIARELGIIENLPQVSKDEIDDKNKGDALFKLLALGQISWFFIQIVVRLGYHIPTSQLEILVLSFAICTALTYVLLLNKPKDASTSITVSAARYPTPREMVRIATAGPYTWGGYRQSIWIPNNLSHYDSDRPSGATDRMVQGSVLALVIFGAVHCVAWDFTFPTQLEKVLWRVCSIATVVAVPLNLGINALSMAVFGHLPSMAIRYYTAGILHTTVTIVFVVSRLFIIVEVFRSLAFLPSEAFRSTWSANLPHLG